MPKKKGFKKITNQDFTIHDSANAPKPVARVKKSMVADNPPVELSWDQILDDDIDIVEEVDSEGVKNFVYKKKRSPSKFKQDCIEDRPGTVYPEIVWYLISKYITPEDVGHFAGINKACYAVTKRESFWRSLYRTYCEGNPKLPEKLHLENSYKLYGLRHRVIRGLYHTHKVFIKRLNEKAVHDSKPHELVKRCCVNVWYCKGTSHWSVYFKLKKLCPHRTIPHCETDFIEELSRIDANPEEDTQVLQVTCRSFYGVPPVMGMTLASVNIVLSQGFRHHKVHLGFHSSLHNVYRDIIPECFIVIDTVVNIQVYDWWHPNYPFDSVFRHVTGDESLPVLKKDFFSTIDGDLL